MASSLLPSNVKLKTKPDAEDTINLEISTNTRNHVIPDLKTLSISCPTIIFQFVRK
jgi:hypothetical protein